MNERSKIFIFFNFCLPLSVLCLLALPGCGKCKGSSSVVIAKINNYELTADDFREKADRELIDTHAPADPEEAKSGLLEEMIMKNILIQEAQAQNFDKDRAFMREIEGYWEQALLKLLIKKKTEEFMSEIKTGDEAARREKARRMLEEWIGDLRRNAKVKIYKKNLKSIQIR